jgi:hypothetical protein
MVQSVTVNRLNGRLATSDTPPELLETKIFTLFPAAAAAWAADQQIPQPPTEFDTLRQEDNLSTVAISAPKPFAIVGDQVDIQGKLNLEPGEQYRITYFSGLAPSAIYLIEEARSTPINLNGDLLGRWDTGSLAGLYTILITILRPDGTFDELDIQVTIDHLPPNLTVVSPLETDAQQTTANRITLEVEADDDVALEAVYFSTETELEPFAVRPEKPFKADLILDENCQTVIITARDRAGNETQQTAGPFCPAE